jgi:DnaJ-class molecular chaperone
MTKQTLKTEDYPAGISMDMQKRRNNIDNKKPLCERCSGTGNELYSMYRKCTDCNGTGIKAKG